MQCEIKKVAEFSVMSFVTDEVTWAHGGVAELKQSRGFL